MRIIASGFAGAGLILFLNAPTAEAVPITFSGSGSSPAGIQARSMPFGPTWAP